MEDLALDDMLAIFKRRRMDFLVTFAIIFVLALAYTAHWSRYRASTTVQIIQPYVSNSVANVSKEQSAADNTGLADRRISQIEQKVTSDESLAKIATTLNLYPGMNKKVPQNVLANAMRSNIRLQFISSDIANPAAVQKESVEQLSAIAFTLSYDYSDPELAKKALDTIVQAFIDEEARQRHLQAKETSDFLDAELKTLDGNIRETEKKIADFRAQYGESGPSAVLFNQQASLTNAMSLESIRGQVNANNANISSLRTQLIGVSPYMSVSDGGDRTVRSSTVTLPALQAEYAQLTTRYGPEHPDVKKVKAQIDALKASGKTNTSPVIGADNPVYVQINTQLAAAEAQRASLQSQLAAAQAQQAKFTASIAKNPGIEQQMSQLTLDLDNAKDRYHTLKDKKLAAEMQEKLESSTNHELLKVINPTTIPAHTTPSRKMLLMAGLLLSILGGVTVVAVREMMSQSIRGAQHLATIVGVAPLVSVPHIEANRG